jgi:hypothetical protein
MGGIVGRDAPVWQHAHPHLLNPAVACDARQLSGAQVSRYSHNRPSPRFCANETVFMTMKPSTLWNHRFRTCKRIFVNDIVGTFEKEREE